MTYDDAVALAKKIIQVVDYDIYKEELLASEDGEYTLIEQVADILFGEDE